jgi:hypothetical protein
MTMLLSALTLGLSLAHAGAPETPAAPVPALDPEVLRLLALRDGVDCAALPVADVADLARYTAPDLQPPAVSVRATGCLVQRFPAEVPALVIPWIGDASREGLVLTVLGGMDALPEASAVAIAQALVATPDARLLGRAGRLLRASKHPGVRALAPAKAPRR